MTLKHITNAICTILFLASCNSKPDEKDKIFQAVPSMSDGIGGTFFSLYKHNKYEFCDGDFMDPGCNTGTYKLVGDTLTLIDLKLNDHVRSTRFIIYRFSEVDSTYWKGKYSNSSLNWRDLKARDSLTGFGDVYELDEKSNPRTNANYWYVIRLDILKNYR